MNPIVKQRRKKYFTDSKVCRIEDCERPIRDQGYCTPHYDRLRGRVRPETPIRSMHGLSKSREHQSWTSMKQRCYNPNNAEYSNYGGRGIKVCKRWVDNFEQFYEDMGARPEGRSIDRKNPDGNYTPSNCRWATPLQQTLNRRMNKTNKSGYPGVYRRKDINSREWVAFITVNYKRIHIGVFNSYTKAVEAKKLAERIHHNLQDKG